MIRVERVSTALIAMLEDGLSVPVGDHGAATSAGVSINDASPYVIVWRIPGGRVDGSFGNPNQSKVLVYQIDSVGRSRQQAEGLADLVEAVMTDVASQGGHTHVLAGEGFTGGLRTVQTVEAAENEGTDEEGSGVWVVRPRYEVAVFPA